MPRITEGQFALGGLAVLAIWLFAILPLLYYAKQETPQSGGQTSQSDQETSYLSSTQPSFVPLKVFTSGGRDEIARYCAWPPSEEKEEWAHSYICEVKITDTYLAVFSLLLVIVTGGLIYVGWKTIGRMRHTEERQLRAYVFITDGGMISVRTSAFRVLVKLRNSGQTPGYQFSTWFGVEFTEARTLHFPPKPSHSSDRPLRSSGRTKR